MKYLTIDVGGTSIKYALMDDNYTFLAKANVKTPTTNLHDFKTVIKEIYEEFDTVDGIAMSLPGLINKNTNTMQIPGALLYNQDVDILQELKSVTIDNLTIENDAKCAALCELELGSLRGTEVGAVCIIGTGIGGAITLGNQVLKGCNGFAGEFSYVSTNWESKPTLDQIWAIKSGVDSLIQKVKECCQLDENIDGIRVFEMCNEGNKLALKVLKEYCECIAIGLYNIQAYVDPDKIAIGGGISKQPLLMTYLQEALDNIYALIPNPIPRVILTNCEFFNDSNLIGALVNYKQIYKI